jgi:hypothetical protein
MGAMMRDFAGLVRALVCAFALVLAAHAADAPRQVVAPASSLLYKARPTLLSLGQFDGGYSEAAVTDVALGDFDGDGRLDIAVAWFATDTSDYLRNVRTLTIFFNQGTSFTRAADIDLYVADPSDETMSVFYIGTSSLGVGDYDGDGDLDLAVMPYFGDEIWVIENLGQRTFTPHLKLPYGVNSPGNPLTPPKVLAGDFDLNGRNELVYVCDPTAQYLSRMMHFWQATGALTDIRRADWLGGTGSLGTWFVRGLAVADFDGDGRPDLCFTGALNHNVETSPVLTFWSGFNSSTRRFTVNNFYPTILCSDVVAVRPTASSPPGVILAGLDGTRIQYWPRTGTGVQFAMTQELTGYMGAPDRGLAVAVADVDGDGDQDLVTKLRYADATNPGQIEFTLWDQATGQWTHAASRVDTTGFTAALPSTFLRPGNLAVGDLSGNALPEVVAGFAARELPAASVAPPPIVVEIAIWANSCLGDVNRDGQTDRADLNLLTASQGTCRGDALFNPDADLDKSGCVTTADLDIVSRDLGCACSGETPLRPGDLNCDGYVDLADINPFVVALSNRSTFEAQHPYCHWLNADCNGVGKVSFADINSFVVLLNHPSPSIVAHESTPVTADDLRVLLSLADAWHP